MKILSIWGLVVAALGVLATLAGLLCMVIHAFGVSILGRPESFFALLFVGGLVALLVVAGGVGLGQRYLTAKDPH